MFFFVDLMPRTMNNSLATTMFEGDSEVVPSSGADVVSSAGPSVLQAGQNISTTSDPLAQAMSKALTDSLPGIPAALHNHNTIPLQPALPNSNSEVISMSSLAPLTQASLGQATRTGTLLFLHSFPPFPRLLMVFPPFLFHRVLVHRLLGTGSCQPFPPSPFYLLRSEKIL